MFPIQVGEAITRGKTPKVKSFIAIAMLTNPVVQEGGAVPMTTILVHLFGEMGKRKLYTKEFVRSVNW